VLSAWTALFPTAVAFQAVSFPTAVVLVAGVAFVPTSEVKGLSPFSSSAGEVGEGKVFPSALLCVMFPRGSGTIGAGAFGDAHGRAPIFRPVITFLPSRHRNKVDRFINRRGIIGLVGFAA
jgi:hypothetical protein